MKKSKIAIIISAILKITLISGIILLFFIPNLYDLFYRSTTTTFGGQGIYYQISFYLCAVLSLSSIYELIRIFDYIYINTPFDKIIEIRLKIMAIIFMLISLIVLIKVIFITTLISLVVVFLTFIASLSLYTLSQVFKKAIEYKNEIDATV